MGSFEKLGVLVIVVIIVMILAVAIYQWGATGMDAGVTVLPVLSDKPETLIVDYDNPPARDQAKQRGGDSAKTASWDGGIPKSYVIQNRDIVWKLVVKRWKLRDSFIDKIKAANPSLNMKRLRAGDKLVIPDPDGYARGSKNSARASGKTVRYQIQNGDRLETIAKVHLGSKSRWKEIEALNPGLDPNNLGLGDTILLPLK